MKLQHQQRAAMALLSAEESLHLIPCEASKLTRLPHAKVQIDKSKHGMATPGQRIAMGEQEASLLGAASFASAFFSRFSAATLVLY